jgi:hypothetical protein
VNVVERDVLARPIGEAHDVASPAAVKEREVAKDNVSDFGALGVIAVASVAALVPIQHHGVINEWVGTWVVGWVACK